MCEPTTIMLAVSAVTAVASAAAQHQQAGRVDAAAQAAQIASNAGLVDQMHQRDAQATDQMVDRSKRAMQDAGALTTIFADSGLTGNTQARISSVSEGNAQADLTTIERNRQNAANQGANEADGIRAQTQQRMNSVTRPSILGTGLQIAGAYANYASQTSGRKP